MPDSHFDTWFAHASLNSQFGYVLACAIADREQSARFWQTEAESETGSPSSVTLAADAVACLKVMRGIQDSLAKGEIVVDRIIPSVSEYNPLDPADGRAPSHRD